MFVAGGLPFNLEIMENVIKECLEEANISFEFSSLAKPVGAVRNIFSFIFI